MNRLAHPIRRSIAVALPIEASPAPSLLDDLKFFAMVWVCGVVFFGTLFA